MVIFSPGAIPVNVAVSPEYIFFEFLSPMVIQSTPSPPLFASEDDLRIDAEHRNQDAHQREDGQHTEQGIFGSQELVVFLFRVAQSEGVHREEFLDDGFYLFFARFPGSFLELNKDAIGSLESELTAKLETCRTYRHGR